ncbi:MAG: sugar lyase, partial [Planctomycetes bacterium]|nr:sugar lyase [Planctomycetota bacterium]
MSILVAIGAAVLSAEQASGVEAERESLRRQFVEYFAGHAAPPGEIVKLCERLREDGTWPDVDYESRQRGGWPTYLHLTRILELARAYRAPGHALRGDERVRDAIRTSLGHWVEKDYRNPNWWYGRIGVPRAVAPILLLMGDDLPADLRKTADETILDRSTMGMTGQNKVWVAGIAFMKGWLREDPDLMRKGRDAVVSELRVTTREGVQDDFSFHQHGPQQQWGNYG